MQEKLLQHLNAFMLGSIPILNQVELFSKQNTSYPPYDIEVDEKNPDSVKLILAVAGFKETDLTLTVKENVLTIVGEKKAESRSRAYQYNGIANRNFERNFVLGQFVEVTSVSLEDGLLVINIEKIVPDHAKPKQIAIGTSVK